ncbi:hypothetical protein SEPCBS119000_003593 [Sporothrix epigloea]|uniref:alpha-1,2-Mannosidase n=1 Tax=Sporothrix epigloea TaxID=1892477 RepID=A0ABP0DPG0_9PEZI
MAYLRFRRYRVYIFAAVLLLFIIFRLSHSSDLGTQKQATIKGDKAPPDDPITYAHSNNIGARPDVGLAEVDVPPKDAPENDSRFVAQVDLTAGQPAQDPKLSTSIQINGQPDLPNSQPSVQPVVPQQSAAAGQEPVAQGNGAPDSNNNLKTVAPASRQATATAQQTLPSTSAIHWIKMAEHFPVPEESLISLPTGKPKSIPRIQHDFKSESSEAREIRESRLASVRTEMQHAWSGYRTYAWTHDELTPISKGFSDPFCGWAASLVDALDTLWIMKMYDEFDEAYEAVKQIDFTTTPFRDEIPVFETIIRYLGGLVAAYDVSGGVDGKYPMFLTKAVQLAEILMAVFDTPNRMPILYYSWKPTSDSHPKTASSSVSVAELGSMSMEFTRLAQLTGQNKYYDAIARITDAFEEWQNRINGTAIPGLLPERIDASGCNVTAAILAANDDVKAADIQADPLDLERAEDESYIAKALHSNPGYNVNYDREPDTPDAGEDISLNNHAAGSPHANGIAKRAAPDNSAAEEDSAAAKAPEPVCIPQNLTAGGYGVQTFGMGGSQDSAYEYFPKQYLLLGGLVPKYRAMHEKVADAVKKHLLYRPMIKDDRNILFSAKVASQEENPEELIYNYEITHLTCFLGGMFAMGGRIFDRPDDIEIAAKLADGCVWSYEVMPMGIMPEASVITPCANITSCPWNETAWFEQLDPDSAWRDRGLVEYEEHLEAWTKLKSDIEQYQQSVGHDKDRDQPENKSDAPAGALAGAVAESSEANPSSISKRDSLAGGQIAGVVADVGSNDDIKPILDDSNHGGPDTNIQSVAAAEVPAPQAPATSPVDAAADQVSMSTEPMLPPMPRRPMSHMDFVRSRIERDNLQPGFVYVNDPRYILRPEAIESVWYMYRITGDPSWQEKGWRMFQAVIRASRTEYGHSAVTDVTADPGQANNQLDNMESFWFAETLKYFYLLFTTPDVISLDDYVLNTEAHPFKRPT